MEILKKVIIVTAFVFQGGLSIAQNDATLQSVFSESYVLENSKKYNEAIAVINKQYSDKSYEINIRLGWLYYNNKNYLQSQSHYQNAVALKPYSVEAKLGLVKALAALEAWDKLLATYEDILRIDAQNYTANYWAGVMLYNRKNYEAASKYFEKLVNLYPFDYDANHMMAWTCLNMGRSADAKMLFYKALLNRPSDASSLEGLKRLK